eukprot:139547_1
MSTHFQPQIHQQRRHINHNPSKPMHSTHNPTVTANPHHSPMNNPPMLQPTHPSNAAWLFQSVISEMEYQIIGKTIEAINSNEKQKNDMLLISICKLINNVADNNQKIENEHKTNDDQTHQILNKLGEIDKRAEQRMQEMETNMNQRLEHIEETIHSLHRDHNNMFAIRNGRHRLCNRFNLF